MQYKVKDWFEEYKRQNPERYALFGKAIVGELGLTVEWANPDGTKGQKRYKEDDELQICEIINDNTLSVSGDFPGECVLHKDHFKGFSRKIESSKMRP